MRWVDDFLEDSEVEAEALSDIRRKYSKVNFVSGFMGDNIQNLPDNYFDLAVQFLEPFQ